MKNIGKKGMVENFIALVIVGAGLILIFGGLFLLLQAKARSNENLIASDLNIQQGFYSTRVILSANLTDDYQVYDAVIDFANGKGGDIDAEILAGIRQFYPEGTIGDKWLVIVNEHCVVLSEGRKDSYGEVSSEPETLSSYRHNLDIPHVKSLCERQVVNKMPKITVPNPNGANIVVLIKPASYLDGASARLFGYRADMIKGTSDSNIPDFSLDGKTLAEIQSIKNVNCNEETSTVGRICVADEQIVQKLRQISAEKLQPENMKIEITQAYRTYEIQKTLYNQWCAKGKCENGCNPDGKNLCPHMMAGAVDVIMYDSQGKALNGKSGYNPALVEEIMCSYGFVRYRNEDWHFEYGTRQWGIAEDKRAAGEKVCVY